MQMFRSYQKQIHKQLDYYATWLPNAPIEVGQILRVGRNDYSYVDNLKSLDVGFSVESGGEAKSQNFTSRGAVQVRAKGSGEATLPDSAIGKASAGVNIRFSKEDAVLLRTNGCRVWRMANQLQVGREIERRYAAKEWERDLQIVVEVLRADATTVIFSSDTGSSVDIVADGAAAISEADLAKADLGLKFLSEGQIGYSQLASPDLTPLFRIKGIKGIFRPRMRSRTGRGTAAAGDERPDRLVFEAPTPDDIWSD